MEVVITEVVIMEVDQGTPPEKVIVEVDQGEVVIMEVDQGTPLEVVITEVVIMEVDQGTPLPPRSGHHGSWPGYPLPPPTPEVVTMEVDQGTPQKWSSWKLTRVPPPPSPIWTDHTLAIGSWFSFEKRISTCCLKFLE